MKLSSNHPPSTLPGRVSGLIFKPQQMGKNGRYRSVEVFGDPGADRHLFQDFRQSGILHNRFLVLTGHVQYLLRQAPAAGCQETRSFVHGGIESQGYSDSISRSFLCQNNRPRLFRIPLWFRNSNYSTSFQYLFWDITLKSPIRHGNRYSPWNLYFDPTDSWR